MEMLVVVSAVVMSPLVCLGILLGMDSLEQSLEASVRGRPSPRRPANAARRRPRVALASAGEPAGPDRVAGPIRA